MNCSQYIIARAQAVAGAQAHLVANLVGAYRNAGDNHALALRKGRKDIAQRSAAIFGRCEAALEQIGRGLIVKRADVSDILI